MKLIRTLQTLASIAVAVLSTLACANSGNPTSNGNGQGYGSDDDRPASVQLGPRPFFLLNDMDEGPLQRRLQSCAARRKNFEAMPIDTPARVA